MALAGVTDQIVYLEEATSSTCSWALLDRATAKPQAGAAPVTTVQAHSGAAELGPVPPLHAEGDLRAAARHRRHAARRGRIIARAVRRRRLRVFKEIDSVLILACGTSYYSGCTAKYWLESIAKIPTQVEIASEYRYRDSVPNPRTLVVTISQSARRPTRWPR
jgi:glucosamine--fructose-6-phosphate aminotransferase (isomerizing)